MLRVDAEQMLNMPIIISRNNISVLQRQRHPRFMLTQICPLHNKRHTTFPLHNLPLPPSSVSFKPDSYEMVQPENEK